MARIVAVLMLVATACTTVDAPLLDVADIPTGPLTVEIETALDALFADPVLLTRGDISAVDGDLRVAWILADFLRFHQGLTKGPELIDALARLTGVRYQAGGDVVPWVAYTDLLLRSDVPAPPGYLDRKRSIYVGFHERWAPFFDDSSDLDWRTVSWGGVLRDGIPDLDDPPTVNATDATWSDEEVVFGVLAGAAARAYPRRVLEVHEIVNDTLAGSRVALPYCTLCATAIAYLPGDDVSRLRTSGLLQRSNKLMYDTRTESLFDQFAGVGVTGPSRGIELARLPLTVTTWGAWRTEHPDTTTLPTEIKGREYGPDPLDGRDDDGPIFPVGSIDERLPPHRTVIGTTTARGAVAFPVDEASAVLSRGGRVTFAGVDVALRAGGLVLSSEGADLDATEAFWFAWSQFHPGTALWRA